MFSLRNYKLVKNTVDIDQTATMQKISESVIDKEFSKPLVLIDFKELYQILLVASVKTLYK